MTETAVAIGVVVIICVAFLALMFRLERRHPCDCGRSRAPYFYTHHEKGWVMLLWVLWLIPATISSFISLNYVTIVINTLLLGWHGLRWWYHEKEKMKKKAAKLAGRVSINSHGRLVVTNN